MIDFNLLKTSKKDQQNNDTKRIDLANEFYNKALDKLNKFNQIKPYNKVYIKEAFSLLNQSLKYRRTSNDSYICLAYICYILDDLKSALKYLSLAETLSANTALVDDMKLLITKNKL